MQIPIRGKAGKVHDDDTKKTVLSAVLFLGYCRENSLVLKLNGWRRSWAAPFAES